MARAPAILTLLAIIGTATACGETTASPSGAAGYPTASDATASPSAPSPTPAARPLTCAEISRLIEADKLQSAALAYAQRTARTFACTEPPEFRAQLQAADTAARLGDEYRRRGQATLAEAQYQVALDIDSEQPIALAGMEALRQPPAPTPSPTPDPIALAKALYDAGYEDEARVQVVKGLEANPSASVPGELDRLASWPPGPARGVAHWVWPILPVLLVLGVLGFLAWIRRRPAQGLLDPFDTKAIDEKLGSSVPELIAGELSQMTEEGAGRALGFVSGPDPAITLPAEIVSLVPHGKVAAALLSLLPGRPAPYRIDGTAQPRGDRGFGLSVSIANPKGAVTSTTIWEKDVDPDMPDTVKDEERGAVLHRLALAATAWLLYHLPAPSGYLLTDDWRSYMFFRVGASWQEDGDPRRARLMYELALRQDSANRGALFNLGVMDAQSAEGTATDRSADYQVAMARFILGRRQVVLAHERAGTDPYLDRLWYRMTYNIAASAFHQQLEGSDRKGKVTDDQLARLKSARDQVRVAIGLIGRVIEQTRSNDARYGELRRFLGETRLAGAVLLADIIALDTRLQQVNAVSLPAAVLDGQSRGNRLKAAWRVLRQGAPA